MDPIGRRGFLGSDGPMRIWGFRGSDGPAQIPWIRWIDGGSGISWVRRAGDDLLGPMDRWRLEDFKDPVDRRGFLGADGSKRV